MNYALYLSQIYTDLHRFFNYELCTMNYAL